MIHDYKSTLVRRHDKSSPIKSHWHWHGALFFLVGAMLAVLLIETEKTEASVQQKPAAEDTQKIAISKETIESAYDDREMETYELSLPPRAKTTSPLPSSVTDKPPAKTADSGDWQSFVVKPGFNLAIISSRAGVNAGEIHTLMQLGKPVEALKTLYPNDIIGMKILPDGRLAGLKYDIDKTQSLVVTRLGETPDGNSLFKAEVVKKPVEVRTKHATGIIDDSLFLAARSAGLSDKKAIELAGIFAWDIDFAHEVRKGDHFTVVYEEQYQAGEKIGEGPIIAAEFVNQNQVYRAIRYTDPAGDTDYYAPDGSRLRKSFLRNPIKPGLFRISSRFDLHRKHPILHKIRAHKGVDFAASIGTPIRATGDGKVILRGRKGGYGNAIIIQHGRHYSTLYGHMSRFANNIRVGQRVKQGQIIGYVGQSGLATGPHVHYEFRIDGVHHNPLTVKYPSGEPVPERYKQDFLAKIESPMAQLDTLGRMMLALDDVDQESN
jgi:murein DD-endopeptidase MepM/ murein hydrolase activator NlpD